MAPELGDVVLYIAYDGTEMAAVVTYLSLNELNTVDLYIFPCRAEPLGGTQMEIRYDAGQRDDGSYYGVFCWRHLS